jgi:hypothetical protein
MIKILSYISRNVAGVQGTLFLIIAITELFKQGDNNFWMFLFASVAAGALQDIINELRKSNKQENEQS